MVVTSRPRVVHRVRASILALTAAAGVAALSGCTPTAAPPTHTTAATPPAASSPTGKPTTPATPTSVPWTPVTLTCDALLTPQQMYEYNPNFGKDPDYKPKPGSDAARIVASKGLACGWLNQTSGDKIEIAMGRPPAATLTDLNNRAVTTSHAVPTYGVPPAVWGYFNPANSSGEAQIFQNGYWVVWNSSIFLEPGDAAPLVADVQANLPKP